MQLREFVNPGKRYRPTVVWSWNDTMEPGDVENRIRDLRRKGFGGFIIEARQGLRTAYLSDDWMRAVRRAVEIARDADLECWFADEDTGPTGTAGGEVVEADDHLARALVWHEHAAVLDADTLDRAVAFTVPSDDGGLRTVTERPAELEGAGVFVVERFVRGAGRFSGGTYADLLNPGAAAAFREATLDRYAKLFLNDFGEHMPGIVTLSPTIARHADWVDEANRHQFAIPWTPGLTALFEELHGYKPTGELHLLLAGDPSGDRLRRDIHHTLAERFRETWLIPYADWCREHKLALTGTVGTTGSLADAIRSCGSPMAVLEYLDVPIVPVPGDGSGAGRPILEAASVAAQTGRSRIAGMLLEGAGHGVSFAAARRIADRAAAHGITSFRLHAFQHTIRGNRKRDWPPAFSTQQPYWEQVRVLTDYLGRLSWALDRGSRPADILVVEPVEAIGECLGMGLAGKERAHAIEESFTAVVEELDAAHMACDLGDVRVLDRHGKADGPLLRVGAASYRAVVLPPSGSWPSELFGLLQDFTGPVYILGEAPARLNGRPDDRLEPALARNNVHVIPADPVAVVDRLVADLGRQDTVTDETGAEARDVLLHHRVDGGAHIFLLANMNSDLERRVTLTTGSRGGVVELDPLSGRAFRYAATVENGLTAITTTLPASGSRLFLVDQSQTLARVAVPDLGRENLLAIAGPYTFTRSGENTLVLDRCTLAVDGRTILSDAPMWKVREAVWEETGLRKYRGWQPWVLDKRNVRTQTNNTVLTFTFTVLDVPETVHLAMESSDRFTVTCNGAAVQQSYGRWHLDRKITVVDIKDHLVPGVNVITATTDYLWDTELEPLYLFGDFAVGSAEDGFPVIAELETLDTGSWTLQGYPFFAGSITYHLGFALEPIEGERYELDLSGTAAASLFVKVNGTEVGAVPFPPYRADITGALRSGDNEIEIEVFGTLRNAIGPLHNRFGDTLPLDSPAAFTDPETWTDDTVLAEYGFLSPPSLVKITGA